MRLTRLLLAGVILLTPPVGILLLRPQVCVAGQPNPCKDTEHPDEPPCNMGSCKRMTGGSVCSHYCSKGKGCCFCKQDQCGTTRPPEGSEAQ